MFIGRAAATTYGGEDNAYQNGEVQVFSESEHEVLRGQRVSAQGAGHVLEDMKLTRRSVKTDSWRTIIRDSTHVNGKIRSPI